MIFYVWTCWLETFIDRKGETTKMFQKITYYFNTLICNLMILWIQINLSVCLILYLSLIERFIIYSLSYHIGSHTTTLFGSSMSMSSRQVWTHYFFIRQAVSYFLKLQNEFFYLKELPTSGTQKMYIPTQICTFHVNIILLLAYFIVVIAYRQSAKSVRDYHLHSKVQSFISVIVSTINVMTF